jgi:NADPH2:quinone reductase
MKSRVIIMDEQGAPSVLRQDTVELDAPGPGEVRLRQTAMGLNYMDVYQRSGYYPLDLPSGLGMEAAGVIEAVGNGVDDFKEGDRAAYGGGPPGGYAEYRNLPASRLVKIPDAVTDEQAAATMLKGMTVEYLLNRTYQIKAGESVLFWAAAGGVGLLAGQWGKDIGARMIGIAGGAEKCALALANGYEAVIDHKSEDVVARVKELTDGNGVPVAYDSVGKATFEKTLDCLATRGMFVSFGTTSGSVPPVIAADLQHRGSLYFCRPSLANYCVARDDLVHSAAAVFSMIGKGAITIEINQRYPLADIVQAHTDLEAGRTSGSTIITP